MVFCGLFPIDSDDYPDLRDALEKLTLNDAALTWEPETSDALGFGFRCGFLGLLHMDIVRERLQREYDLELLATMPSVGFEVTLTNGEELEVHAPSDMPDPARIEEIREPYIRRSIVTPKEYIGQVMELCQERRGDHAGMHYLSRRARAADLRPAAGRDRPRLLRPAEVAHPRLRVAGLRDHRHARRRPGQARRAARRRPVDALSMLVHSDKAYAIGRTLTEKLRAKIPRQQYDVPIQAAIGSHIIARETVKAFRKDVIAKCYGGDIIAQAQAAGEAEGGQAAHEAGRAASRCPRRRSSPCWSSATEPRRRRRLSHLTRALPRGNMALPIAEVGEESLLRRARPAGGTGSP